MANKLIIAPHVIGKIARLSMNRAKFGKRFSTTEFVNNSEIRVKIIQDVLGDGDQESLTLVVELMQIFLDLGEVSDKQIHYDIGVADRPKASSSIF